MKYEFTVLLNSGHTHHMPGDYVVIKDGALIFMKKKRFLFIGKDEIISCFKDWYYCMVTKFNG